MESAHDIQWDGDSRERLLERAAGREAYSRVHGPPNLGGRLLQEVQNKISELAENLNLYSERDNQERVAPLSSSKYVLVYKKEYYEDGTGKTQARLLC